MFKAVVLALSLSSFLTFNFSQHFVPFAGDIIACADSMSLGGKNTNPSRCTLDRADVLPGGSFIGKSIHSADGQKVGVISDVRRSSSGQPLTVKIRTGGLFGFGGHTPLILSARTIEVSGGQEKLVVNASKSDLLSFSYYDRAPSLL